VLESVSSFSHLLVFLLLLTSYEEGSWSVARGHHRLRRYVRGVFLLHFERAAVIDDEDIIGLMHVAFPSLHRLT
jgi:hypothetical protein